MHENSIEQQLNKKERMNEFWENPNFKIEINGELLTLKECYEKVIKESREIFEKTKLILNESVPKDKFILYVNQTEKGMLQRIDPSLINKERLEKMREAETGKKDNDSRFKVFNSYNEQESFPDLNNCVGIIFSGGEAYINGEEDQRRKNMLDRSRKIIQNLGHIPKLGICLGAQLLAHENGMEIDWVKNQNKINERIVGMDKIIKNKDIKNSFLKNFDEITYIAENHGQEIKNSNIKNAKIIGQNERGDIEIIEFNNNTICIQGHPEVGSIRMDIGMILNEIYKNPNYIFQNNLEKTRELIFTNFIYKIKEFQK